MLLRGETPVEPVPSQALEAADPGERRVDRMRQRIVMLAAALGALLCFVFWGVQSAGWSPNPGERIVLPLSGGFFALLTLLAWRRAAQWTEWGLALAGIGLLLERIHHALAQPVPPLERVLHAHQLLAWFPSLYLLSFLLFDKRHALFLCVAMLGAGVFIVGQGAPGIPIQAHESYVSHVVCIAFVFALSGLKERYVATQREAGALRSYAETDFLTGVANRRSLSEALDRELRRCRSEGSSLALILLDVDRFKDVNDTLGHEEGDRALRRIALLMDRNRRRSDVFGRWGGEEFLLVAPDLDLDGGRRAAERLRAIIEESSRGTRAPVTASFGVAQLAPGDDMASLVRRADEALIAAKGAGRNRVEARAAA